MNTLKTLYGNEGNTIGTIGTIKQLIEYNKSPQVCFPRHTIRDCLLLFVDTRLYIGEFASNCVLRTVYRLLCTDALFAAYCVLTHCVLRTVYCVLCIVYCVLTYCVLRTVYCVMRTVYVASCKLEITRNNMTVYNIVRDERLLRQPYISACVNRVNHT